MVKSKVAKLPISTGRWAVYFDGPRGYQQVTNPMPKDVAKALAIGLGRDHAPNRYYAMNAVMMNCVGKPDRSGEHYIAPHGLRPQGNWINAVLQVFGDIAHWFAAGVVSFFLWLSGN